MTSAEHVTYMLQGGWILKENGYSEMEDLAQHFTVKNRSKDKTWVFCLMLSSLAMLWAWRCLA